MKRYDFNEQWTVSKKDSNKLETVNLPHDAMIQEKRQPDNPSGSAGAYFSGGIYEYKKSFEVPLEWKDKHIAFQFEGIYKDSRIYINENNAGGRPNGYMPIVVSADAYLKYGQTNTIRVVADNSEMPNSRWYSGTGIYRPAWLWIGNKEHIMLEGVTIETLSYQPAKVRIKTKHNGTGQVEIEIKYKKKVVCKLTGEDVVVEIPEAKLWSAKTPKLYTCCASLKKDNQVIDQVTATFGIRQITWSPAGLFINGKKTLLRGGCIHHDHGILGARSYAKSEERRVQILKKAGFNAIRSSHNPASPEMLAACDRIGMYVMDETWDMWYHHKTACDYAGNFEEWYKKDMEDLVRRDFNHPSVIMYSIGNEVTEPAEAKGIQLEQEMTAYMHHLDASRPVTCGINLWLLSKTSKGKGVYQEKSSAGGDKKRSTNMNSTVFNMIASKVGTSMNNGARSKSADALTSPCLELLDIAGYNYSSGRYPLEKDAHPNRVVVGSETFPQDIWKNWQMVKKYPYLIGDFVWTAWDYLGEAGLGAWAYTDDAGSFDKPYPWMLADAGVVDILGNANAEADYAAVVWGLRDKPALNVQPVNHPGQKVTKMVWRGTNAISSWAWQNCEGNKAVIEVYSKAPVVKLFLNGRCIGKKRTKACRAIFKKKYSPGTLIAVSYDQSGQETGRSELKSATGSLRVKVKAEDEVITKGDIVYLDISIRGENQVVESNADTKLSISVKNGELLAFGSANPRTEEAFWAGTYTTYYGRAQAVVRGNAVGEIEIEVNGKGLLPGSGRVKVVEAQNG